MKESRVSYEAQTIHLNSKEKFTSLRVDLREMNFHPLERETLRFFFSQVSSTPHPLKHSRAALPVSVARQPYDSHCREDEVLRWLTKCMCIPSKAKLDVGFPSGCGEYHR